MDTHAADLLKRLKDLFATVSDETSLEAYQIVLKDKVREFKCFSNTISSRVEDLTGRTYGVKCFFNKNSLSYICSCQSEVICKHLSSTFLHAILKITDNPSIVPPESIASSFTSIFDEQLKKAPPVIEAPPPPKKCSLSYRLNFKPLKEHYSLSIVALIDSDVHFLDMHDAYTPEFLAIKNLLDKTDIALIEELREYANKRMPTLVQLKTSDSMHLLQRIIESGRAFLHPSEKHLVWGRPLAMAYDWNFDYATGNLNLKFAFPGSQAVLITGSSPPCYYNSSSLAIGLIHADECQEELKRFLDAPEMMNGDLVNMLEPFKKQFPNLAARLVPVRKMDPVPLPKPHFKLRTIKDSSFARDKEIVADLTFYYGGYAVPFVLKDFDSVVDKKNIISAVKLPDEVVLIERDMEVEGAYVLNLSGAEWNLVSPEIEKRHGCSFSYHAIDLDAEEFYDNYESEEEVTLEHLALKVMEKFVPAMQASGSIVEFDPSFPVHKIIDVDDWYCQSDDSRKSSSTDWFDITLGVLVEGERISLLPLLRELSIAFGTNSTAFEDLKALTPDGRYPFLLRDGRCLKVSLERIQNILQHLMVEFAQAGKSDTLRISKWNAPFLQELTQGEAAARNRWIGSDSLRLFSAKIKENHQAAPVEPPSSFMCQLRPYQQQGLNWMQFLRRSDLNGILADDMGLGKTIQTLAHLLIEKESGRMDIPVLIVAPTSLMPNWFNEAARFAPSLSVLVLHGTDRKRNFATLKNYDVILTTYPLLQRDKDVLLQQQYHMLILDEAQMVKNHKTFAYQILQQIKCRHRLCLSGTPMENHLGELWALFHLMLPGFLGDEKSFNTLYRKPIEKSGHSERKEALSKRIRPFILRRTKQQVALDLPEKFEIIQRIELKEKQRDLYEAIRIKAQNNLMEQIQEHGIRKSQIAILDALLKLRQVCCDPRLVKLNEVMQVEQSAKLEFLMEALTQMLEEGRKILLFSQFTSMLALIEQELREKGIDYTILTGDTKDRATPVQTFQDGKVSVMLISLKAGGVGLNLTAADTVIHYDPWWNPAAENQATDRAHRMGQKNNVFVYKLVISGSLEEKILLLQDRKKGLISSILDSSDPSKAEITLEDLEMIFQPLPPPV